jgi:hypothetical protein
MVSILFNKKTHPHAGVDHHHSSRRTSSVASAAEILVGQAALISVKKAYKCRHILTEMVQFGNEDDQGEVNYPF